MNQQEAKIIGEAFVAIITGVVAVIGAVQSIRKALPAPVIDVAKVL